MTEDTSTTQEAKPFLTCPEPITDPKAVIEEFFRHFHLRGIQEYFWEICKGALASPHYDSAYDRSNLVYSAELIAQFFAAVQQIYAPQAGSNWQPSTEQENLTKDVEPDPTLDDAREVQTQLNILISFLSTHSLDEMERDLGTWLKVALCTDNFAYQNGKERGNLIAMHDQLLALIRSLHQFSQAIKPEKSQQ
jgi:hypothetical protein